MKRYRSYFNENIENIVTQEMIEFFNDRTEYHINLVISNGMRLLDYLYNNYNLDYSYIKNELDNHDKSKYSSEELLPYIVLSWQYKCKAEGIDFKISDEIQNLINKATLHHINKNPHHTEYWSIGKKNNLLDASDMTKEDLVCLVADWLAMSEEKETSTHDWFDTFTTQKVYFTNEQKAFIKELINIVEKE